MSIMGNSPDAQNTILRNGKITISRNKLYISLCYLLLRLQHKIQGKKANQKKNNIITFLLSTKGYLIDN